MLQAGDALPIFSLQDQNDDTVTNSDLADKWTLLYFYPKDDTPGCTTEACTLRDAFPHFEGVNAQVIGVSADSVKSHAKFAKKNDLPFTLLADVDRALCEAFGVIKEKSMFGKTFMGIARASFLISPDGVIQKVYPKVKPADHAAEVQADLAKLQANT